VALVLVVDDHPSNRDLVTTLLGYGGHRFIEASDGAEALVQTRAERPDLVICDILMPRMDGYEFVRRLRADPVIAATHVVFYTATFMESEARALARSCGVSLVLTKPCEPQEILRTVERALSRHEVTDGPPDDAAFDREHLRLITDKLVAKANELEAANQRLSSLIGLNLELASEHDPYTLLAKVCLGARDLLGSRAAVLRARQKDRDGQASFVTVGLAEADVELLRKLPPDAGPLGEVMRERRARRIANPPPGDPAAAGFPIDHPAFRSALLAPIVSLHHAYGTIMLIDKAGAAAFTEEEERILSTYAAQAGRIYENGSLYLAMERSAEQLRLEIGERERAAAELREINETLEQRVERRTADLREVIEGLESFNRSVSHDLRGPLGSIAGVAKLAHDHVTAGDIAKAERLLQMIVTSATTTEKLVGALLAMARAADATLHTQHVDPNLLVREVLDSLRPPDAESLPVTVLPMPAVEADPTLLSQVFVNLIGNALKFSAHAVPSRIEVGCVNGHGGGTAARPMFYVRDNGVGLRKIDSSRLFKPFQRLHGTRFDGFGVGLSVVKRIVDRHGGEIRAEETPGGGATFFFALGPRDPRDPSEPVARRVRQAS
jgi:signal transduction histidine kinase/CheY-like chemotaxis protein